MSRANRLGAGGKRLLRCARGGAGTRPERKLRALECLLASPCARPGVEGEGRDPGEPSAAAALGDHELRAAQRHPPEDIRPRPARRDTTHFETGALRARRLAVRLLRLGVESADARPRRTSLARRDVRMGERRHVLRAVQPQQGRPLARRDEHAAPHHSTASDSGALHPPDHGTDPRRLAHVLARPSRRVANAHKPPEDGRLMVDHCTPACGRRPASPAGSPTEAQPCATKRKGVW
jgi:hypothetical protein